MSAPGRGTALLRSPWPRLALFVALVVAAVVLTVTRGAAAVADVRDAVAGLGPAAAPAFVALYALASMALLPVALLSVLAGVLFGPAVGVVVVWFGAVLGACGSFALGRALSRPAVEALAGERIDRLDRFLARRAFLAVLVVRLVPLFAFVLVNYGAAATAIRFRPYLAGTAIGIVPGLVALVVLGGSAAAPTSAPFLLAVGALVVLTGGGVLLARRLRARDDDPGDAADAPAPSPPPDAAERDA